MERVIHQKRAAGLFFSLSKKFSTGEPYEKRVLSHPPLPFRMQQLELEGNRFEIGITIQKHLITVLLLAQEVDEHDRPIGEFRPILCVNGGKLCPQGQEYFYLNQLQMRILEKNHNIFWSTFPLNELIAGLGGTGERDDDIEIYLEGRVYEKQHATTALLRA